MLLITFDFFSILKPHDGHAGGWTQFSETTCKNNFIYGVAIEIYPKDGTFTDSRGATNLRMVCADEKVMEVSNNDKKYVAFKSLFSIVILVD